MGQKQSNGNPYSNDSGPDQKWPYAFIFVVVILFVPQFILVAIPAMLLHYLFLRKK